MSRHRREDESEAVTEDEEGTLKRRNMKKSIKRKMSMYRMVIDVLNEYQPVWAGTPKFVEAHGLLTTKFESIVIQAEKERSYTVGVRNSRDDLRRETARLGARIAAALTAYGEEVHDLELIALMRITESQLMRYSQNDTIILIDRILLHANDHAADLPDYGIDAVTLAEFTLRRDNLVSGILAPRKAIVKRKDTSGQILQLSNDIDTLLRNKIDKLVKVLRPANESMYVEYMNSRMILEYGRSGASGEVPPEPDDGF